MKKTALILALVLLLSLTGCEKSGGGGAFIYHLPTGVQSLDPQTVTGDSASTAITALFEGLCRLNAKGEATPGVAKHWESNPDFTRYTFTLRENARWSDGTTVTAQDFVYGWARALAPETLAVNLEDLFAVKNAKEIHDGAAIARDLGVSAPNATTLVVELERPMENFPELTAGARFMPCNREFFASAAGRYGLQSRYLLTNGPFTFGDSADWKQSIFLARSVNYRGNATVRPDSLTLVFGMDKKLIDDPVTALLNGQADILPLSVTQATAAASEGGNITALTNRVTGLLFNGQDQTLQHKDLRSLFLKNLDHTTLSALPEKLESTTSLVPDNIKWQENSYSASATPNSLQANTTSPSLSSVLERLNMDTIPSITIICQDDAGAVAIANKILIAWNQSMGTYFNIQPLSPTEFDRRIANGNYQAAVYDLTALGDTPYSFFKIFESTCTPQLLSSTAYDTLLHAPDKTRSSYEEMEHFLQDESIFYPIHKEKSYYGISPKARGIVLTTGYLDFMRAEK